MNPDDILRMAREADRWATNQTSDTYEWKVLRDERFAALVATELRRLHTERERDEALLRQALEALVVAERHARGAAETRLPLFVGGGGKGMKE